MNMRKLQEKALEEQSQKMGATLSWSDDLSSVSECADLPYCLVHSHQQRTPSQ